MGIPIMVYMTYNTRAYLYFSYYISIAGGGLKTEVFGSAKIWSEILWCL